VSLVGNHFTGPVRLSGNSTGTDAIVVSGNTIAGVLVCSANEPAPDNGGSPNTISGIALGQCRDL
jgi:hypothetical protein